MDNELFLKRLSEVSEWHRSDGTNYHKDNKKIVSQPPVYTEAELAEMTDEEAEELYEWVMAWREQQPNEGLPPLIKTVKIQAIDCEDCGRHCPNGRKTEHKLCTSGSRHWRHRCGECGFYKDPADGTYSLDAKGVHQYLGSYYRPKQGVYKSRHNPNPQKKVSIVKERAKERLKELLPAPTHQMTAYDLGDSIVYRREPISKG
jgi:hypothetical protein